MRVCHADELRSPRLLSLSLRKKQSHLRRLRRSRQRAHHHQAKQRSNQSRKDRITLRQHRRQMPFDHLQIPEESNQRPHRDGAHRTLGIRTPAIKRSQYHRRERSGVNGIRVKSLSQHRAGIKRLVKRPDAEHDHHQAGNDKHPLIRSPRRNVTSKHIIDQVRRRRKQVVVGGRDDLGEHRSHQQRTQPRRQSMQRRIGDDLSRALMNLAR